MTTSHFQVHVLSPTPVVGSYSGFAQKDALLETLLVLLIPDQARTKNQYPHLRHWFNGSGGGVLEIEEPLLQDLIGFLIVHFFLFRVFRAYNVTQCR